MIARVEVVPWSMARRCVGKSPAPATLSHIYSKFVPRRPADPIVTVRKGGRVCSIYYTHLSTVPCQTNIIACVCATLSQKVRPAGIWFWLQAIAKYCSGQCSGASRQIQNERRPYKTAAFPVDRAGRDQGVAVRARAVVEARRLH